MCVKKERKTNFFFFLESISRNRSLTVENDEKRTSMSNETADYICFSQVVDRYRIDVRKIM